MSVRLRGRACALWLCAVTLPLAGAPMLPQDLATRPWAGSGGQGLMLEAGVTALDASSASSFAFGSYDTFGFGLFRDGDLLGWRFSGGLSLPGGLSAGISLRLTAGEGWTDASADLGLGWALGQSVLAEISIENAVLSRDAAGRITPGYRFGLLFGAAGDWLGFEPWLRFPVGSGSLDAGARLVLLPLAGLRLEAGWTYEDGRHGFVAGLGIGFGDLLVRGRGERRPDSTRAGLSLVLGDHRTGSLAGQDALCLEVSVAGEMAETGKGGNALLGLAARAGFARQLWAIRRAARDPRVRAVLVHLRANGLGWARSEELMQALRAFRASGIPVIAGIEAADLKALMIASAADETHIHESAQVRTAGPAMVATFYTGLLEKIGLRARLLYRSEYKTAAQSVTEREMTPAHRESATRVIDVIRERAITVIASNRALPPERIRGWLARGLMTPRETVRAGVAAGTTSYDAIRRTVAARGLRLCPPAAWLEQPAGFAPAPAIALVHVEGTIVNGQGGMPRIPFGETAAGADEVVRALTRAGSDPAVRGVIVRVQSGGGDVLASERMRAALVEVARRKPTAVSFGDIAASGGYYLACGDGSVRLPVFVKAATLTGSIGVITGKLVSRDLRASLGIAHQQIGDTNANLYGDEEDFTPAQLALVTKILDYWYNEFKSAVARGRRLDKAVVETHARGRVWAGADALVRGLVDHEGGIHEALQWVAAQAGLAWDACALIEINPEPAGLMRLVSGASALDLSALTEADAWPGLFFSGRALALHPWSLRVE